FALVSLNWQRLPQRGHLALICGGFASYAMGLLLLGELLRHGASGGTWLYLAMALTGGGMAAAFSPLMTAIVMRVPVADAGEATGVIVTVNQLALVVGVATFGTLYLNAAGRLPGALAAADGFRLASAHAMLTTCLALAAAAVVGGLLALARAAHVARAQPGKQAG